MTVTDPLPLIEIESLTVRHESGVILEKVSLCVDRASIHVLAGPNGGGKTTLLKSILGQNSFEGTIRCHWRGEGRIGYVPQSLEFDRELPITVVDFLGMALQRRPVCLGVGTSVRTKVVGALEKVGMADRAGRKLGVLSGGELQRVLLARALLPTPELLLLDEPTAGVDEAGLKKLEETILLLKRERDISTLMVRHDLARALAVADRATMLNRTARTGLPTEVLS
jgi:zinc transport system ATP-binding protein